MLVLNNIEVVYDGVILVLKGVSLVIRDGAITTLLGANGAGKTTTLKAISGLLATERGQLTKGTIELDGTRLDRLPAHEVVRCGVTQDDLCGRAGPVPTGRHHTISPAPRQGQVGWGTGQPVRAN